jgi:hypothetical protein
MRRFRTLMRRLLGGELPRTAEMAEVERHQAEIVDELARLTGTTPDEVRQDVAVRAMAKIRQVDHAARGHR